MVHSFYSSRQSSGENIAVEAEVSALRRAGHEVELFAAKTDELERSLLYPIRSALRVATGRGSTPIRAIRTFAPDIVHIHNLFPNFGRRWVWDIQVPILVSVHNYRPVCINGLLLRDGTHCTLCLNGSPWWGLRHRCYRRSFLGSVPLVLANRRGADGDPLLSRADGIRVFSSFQHDILARAGLPTTKLTTIPHFLPNGLDPGRSLASSIDRRSWLFVGRLSREKGVVDLIQSWPKEHALTIVVDGPLHKQCELLASGKPIRILGKAARAVVIDLMTKSAGLVFPSRAPETFGLVYCESLAAGLPVIALAGNTVAESVASEGTGQVVTTLECLSAALEGIEGASDLSQKCRSAFEDRYSEHMVINQLTGLSAQLLKRQGASSSPTAYSE